MQSIHASQGRRTGHLEEGAVADLACWRPLTGAAAEPTVSRLRPMATIEKKFTQVYSPRPTDPKASTRGVSCLCRVPRRPIPCSRRPQELKAKAAEVGTGRQYQWTMQQLHDATTRLKAAQADKKRLQEEKAALEARVARHMGKFEELEGQRGALIQEHENSKRKIQELQHRQGRRRSDLNRGTPSSEGSHNALFPRCQAGQHPLRDRGPGAGGAGAEQPGRVGPAVGAIGAGGNGAAHRGSPDRAGRQEPARRGAGAGVEGHRRAAAAPQGR